ncbi:hypothetical protein PybrP1_003747 [[Pythium] brassicae (nom. inval.)]|nr:hypothetical protein PybrP1_003747 [[Pythium] brassicae (nom. inval.)]
MADGLANAAMDAKASAQDKWPTGNRLLQGTLGWLQNNVELWTEARRGDGKRCQPSSLHQRSSDTEH